MTKFIEGATCARCNNTKRYATCNVCVTCNTTNHAKWVANNKEKSRAYQKAYHAKRNAEDPSFGDRKREAMKRFAKTDKHREWIDNYVYDPSPEQIALAKVAAHKYYLRNKEEISARYYKRKAEVKRQAFLKKWIPFYE